MAKQFDYEVKTTIRLNMHNPDHVLINNVIQNLDPKIFKSKNQFILDACKFYIDNYGSETYQVGIVIKSLRIQRKLTKEGLAAELGISESTIKKYENGERALSITNLFKIIDYFKVDANTILNVAESKKKTSIDSRLELMDCSKKAYFQKIFNEMLDNAEMLVS